MHDHTRPPRCSPGNITQTPGMFRSRADALRFLAPCLASAIVAVWVFDKLLALLMP